MSTWKAVSCVLVLGTENDLVELVWTVACEARPLSYPISKWGKCDVMAHTSAGGPTMASPVKCRSGVSALERARTSSKRT